MSLSVGTQLGRYEIRSLIGAGGMGEVYLAEDTKLERIVALKILPRDVASDHKRMRRFIQEAKAASALNHPNIITIHEVEQIDSIHFIATEFIDGETLRKHLARGPLPVPQALDVAIQIASALSAAHEAGIVHRDIKPENIMLRRDGIVKLLDFGLAKLTEHRETHLDTEAATKALVNTDPGMVMGTISYMSPEQARGRDVDARTDIWSLGVVTYEMVTGRAPFAGEAAADVIASILKTGPAPLLRHTPEAPAKLEEIVAKCLEKDREERYQTAKDLLVDLRRLKRRLDLEAEMGRSMSPGSSRAAVPTISAHTVADTAKEVAGQTSGAARRTASSAEVILGEIKRHKAGAAVVLALLIIASAAIAYAIYKLVGEERHVISFQSAKLTRLTTSGKVRAAVISPDGKYVVHVVDDAGRQSLRVRQIATSSDVEIVAPAPVTFEGLTFTRDGDYVYYVLESKDLPQRALYRVPTLGGAPKRVLTNLEIDAVSFSPDGRRFAFTRFKKGEECAVIIANADGSGEQKLVMHKNPPEHCGWPAWSPGGETIAYAIFNYDNNDMAIYEVRVRDGAAKPLTSQRWYRAGRPAWLADGSGLLMLASDQPRHSYQVWHLSYPGGEAHRVTNDLNDYYGLSLTADSNTLALVQGGGQAGLWVAPGGDAARSRPITSGADKWDGYKGISWTPDGRIVYSPWIGGVGEIWIMDADGRNQRQLAGDGDNRHPAVTPDGRHIFFSSARTGSPHIWRMDIDGGNLKQMTDGVGEGRPNCSPDGRWVVYYTAFGKRTVWRVPADGGEPVRLTDKFSHYPVFSPDGKRIAYVYSDESTYAGIAIIPSEGGEPPKTFDMPPTFFSEAGIRWTPDGRAIAYVDTREGVSNVWAQPLDGGKARPLTHFTSDRIFWFDWSRDGKHLALSRGTETSDVVLISNFR